MDNGSFTGMAATLLIFGLTLENYFLMKAFWEKAGASDPLNSKTFTSTPFVNKITFMNYGRNRFNGFTEWSGTKLQI